MGKVRHLELFKRLKFDDIIKWYMHKIESILENKTHKTFKDFEIPTDHLISIRRPDLMLINKKKFVVSWILQFRKNKRKRIDRQILGPFKRTKIKAVECEGGSDGDTSCSWRTWNSPQSLEKRMEGLGIRGRIEIIQTTALFRSARIFRRVLKTKEDLLPLSL